MNFSFHLEQIFPELEFEAVNPALARRAQSHLDNLTKPPGSLGLLENIAKRLFAIGGGNLPLRVDPCLMLVFAGDHGTTRQKISPFPQAVTRQMVENFLAGGAAINALCRAEKLDLRIVDAGCSGARFPDHPLLLDRRLGSETGDISQEAAMSITDCRKGLMWGAELAGRYTGKDYACLAFGELGIGNSTIATALYCAFFGLSPAEVAGPGSGADAVMISRKISAVEQALRLHDAVIASRDPLRILAALGGYEIVMLTGAMLGCGAAKRPFIVDGFICCAAYIAALAFWEHLADYAFLAHCSAEPGFGAVLKKLRQRPLFDFRMRLGEGSGAALALPILRGAAAIYNEMATFDQAGVAAKPEDRID